MTIAIERFDRSRAEELFTLFASIFGEEAARDYRARYRWIQELHGMPDLVRAWAVQEGGRLVGFLEAIPQRFRIAGREVIVHYPCNYMVAPDHRFHGIALMRRCFQECENCVSLDDVPATIAILQMLKARPVAQAVRFVRWLDGRLLRDRIPRLRAVPGAVFAPITKGLAAWDAVRARRLAPVVEAVDFDERFDRFFETTMGADTVSLVRDAAYLSWRYGPDSPHAARRIGTVLDDAGEILGYVVACPLRASAQKPGFIFELHLRPDAPDDVYGALLCFASRALREGGARTACLHLLPSSHSGYKGQLREQGFRRRATGHVLFAKFRDEALKSAALELAAWRYSFGDAEASHVWS